MDDSDNGYCISYPEGWNDSKVEYEAGEGSRVAGLTVAGAGILTGFAYTALGVYGMIDGNQEAMEISFAGLEQTLDPETGDALRNIGKILSGGALSTVFGALGKAELERASEYRQALETYRAKNR